MAAKDLHLSLPVSLRFSSMRFLYRSHGKRQTCAAFCGSFPAVISISPRLPWRLSCLPVFPGCQPRCIGGGVSSEASLCRGASVRSWISPLRVVVRLLFACAFCFSSLNSPLRASCLSRLLSCWRASPCRAKRSGTTASRPLRRP